MIRPFGPLHFCRTCWLMRPVTALLVVAIVALPWYVAVDLRTDGQWVRGFLLDHNLGRAAQSLEGHGGSILYYPLALLVGFFPWSVFAVPTLLEATRRIRGRDPEAPGYVLAACWMAVYIGAFSLARTKLPSYITPCYPAVAMLVGSYLHAWTRGWQLSAPFWPRLALATLAVVGAGIVAATWFSAARYLSGDSWLAGLGLIPFTAGIAALVLVFRADARRAAARVVAGGAVAFSLLLFSVAAARVDRHQTFDSFVAIMKQRTRHAELGALGVLEPSWVYYTNRHVDLLFLPELHPGSAPDQVQLGAARVRDWEPRPLTHAWHYLRETPDRFVITTRQLLDRIGTLPDGIEVVAETEYFLRSDRLVLLAADCAPPHATARGQTDSAAQSRH
ncbi:MAG: hypothetical protein FJ276_35220 [Planctomycetes bacterium]|nr:hypothetical protein [Planctomycetota bacterium]